MICKWCEAAMFGGSRCSVCGGPLDRAPAPVAAGKAEKREERRLEKVRPRRGRYSLRPRKGDPHPATNIIFRILESAIFSVAFWFIVDGLLKLTEILNSLLKEGDWDGSPMMTGETLAQFQSGVLYFKIVGIVLIVICDFKFRWSRR